MSWSRSSLGLAAVLALGAAPAHADDANTKVLTFATMAGVQAPFLAPTAIRGVIGGGAPWSIARGEGVLRADGELDLVVRGLVLTQTGVNPSPTFRAVVSCETNVLNESGQTVPGVVNVQTEPPTPATDTGDARIRATVPLPDPCYAPVVFVVSGGNGRWFAVTGSSTIDERP